MKIIKDLAIVFVLFMVAAVLYAWVGGRSAQTDDVSDDAVFCTQDAKMCPDGSFVGRVAPNCEFAPCLKE